jgi:urease accessory protein
MPLLRLMHLVSPALPIGAYHFSQGLEYAVEAGWIKTEADALQWIEGLAENALATLDLPLLLRLQAAWQASDNAAAERLSQRLLAARETAELRAEDRHLGRALARVLLDLGIADAEPWLTSDAASHAALFALAASHWQIPAPDAAAGYIWAWCENQVLAAVKLVPLGQRAGQRVLDHLIKQIPTLIHRAESLADDDIGIATPYHGIACAKHETQYSRLFRS